MWTKPVRDPKADAVLILDDTLGEHVGSLFDHGDRPYNHGDDTYPRAHHPVTRHDGSGPVRLPVDLQLSRRYAERTCWEACGPQPFPDRLSPTQKQDRAQRHQAVDPVLLQAPDFQKVQQQFRTTIERGMALLASAMQPKVPLSVLVLARGELAEALGSMARYRTKAWSSLLTQHRNRETSSFIRKDTAGKRLPLAGPHLAVADLVPLIPPTAYREVTVGDKTSWPFPLAVRLPGLGNVRRGVSLQNAALTGTSAVLVSNRADWSAQRIMTLSLQRWPIDPFYQDGTTSLGLDEYRMRSAEALGNHWCLVFVA